MITPVCWFHTVGTLSSICGIEASVVKLSYVGRRPEQISVTDSRVQADSSLVVTYLLRVIQNGNRDAAALTSRLTS